MQTIAEVAAAFAGFAAIVVAVRSRGPDGMAPEDRLRLQVMLGSSLATVGFTFLPQLLVHAGASEPRCWSISSGGILAYLAVVVPMDGIRGRRLSREGRIGGAGAGFAALLALSAFVTQVLNASGLLWQPSFAGFLGGLLLLLALSGFAFFRLVAFGSPAERSVA